MFKGYFVIIKKKKHLKLSLLVAIVSMSLTKHWKALIILEQQELNTAQFNIFVCNSNYKDHLKKKERGKKRLLKTCLGYTE